MIGQLEPGTILAGYEIQSPLGRGGMGDVYLARREGETRVVALKLLSTGLAKETRFRDRFERESHMATSLEHPHIVPVYATGEVDGIRYIAMRYVNGPTLRDLVDDESPLDPRRSLSILSQVASALDEAHAIGLVHRDIKPGNVLIARGGASEFREHAYLTDFGVSKYTGSESDFTRTGQFVGTSLYAAPEQIKGEQVDGRTDVYAFGCVLFECLTGRVPFEKESEAALLWAQMTEAPRHVSTVRDGLPQAVDEVVGKAMAKEPGDRYESCGDVVRAARDALGADSQAGPLPIVAAAPATVVRPVEPTPSGAPAAATVIVPAQPPDPPVEVEAEPIVPLDETPVVPAAPVTVIASAAAIASSDVEAPVLDEAADAPDAFEPPLETETVVPDAPRSTVTTEETGDAPLEAVESSDDDPVSKAGLEAEAMEPAAAGLAAATVIGAASETVVGSSADVVAPAPPSRTGRIAAIAAAVALLVVLGGWVAFSVLGGDDEGGATTSDTVTTTTSVVAPTVEAGPTFSGTARVGAVLTAGEGTWNGSPDTFRYQWRRCDPRGGDCAPIAGAASQTYRLAPADAGRRLRVAVTAENAAGTRTTVSNASSVVAPPLRKPVVVARPTVSGSTVEGGRLRATRGTWRGSGPLDYTYAWLRCNANGGSCTVVQGARGDTYDIRSADIGRRIRVEVRAAGPGGNGSARSNPTSVVRAQQVTPDPTTPDPTTTTPAAHDHDAAGPALIWLVRS